MLLQASKCWAQAGPLGPTEAEAQGAQVLGRGVGRKGRGWPCYCWQEVAPFFPDGETEAQGGLGTCPKSLTVSQLLGRGQLTLGNKVTQTLVTFPLGSEDRQEGLKGPGLPGGEHLAFPRGSVGGQGEVFAWHWAGPSPAREWGGSGGGEGRAFWREQHFWQDGHPLQNLGSKRAAGLFSDQTRPWRLQFFPQALQPSEGPWPGCARRDTASTRGQGWEGRCPHHPPQSGVWGVRGRARLSEASPAHPSRPQALSHLCRRDLGTQ